MRKTHWTVDRAAARRGQASGTVQPRTEHAQLTLYPLPTLSAFPGEAGPCPLYRNEAVQSWLQTSSLHPLPVKMPDTFRLRAHGSHMPLCNLNLSNMHSLPCITGFTCFTRYCSEPTHASRFCLILMPLGASVTCGVR